jgi:putative addiction module killer protein
MMITLRQYLEESGRNPFAEWFDALDTQAFAKVTAALTRIGEGNFSQVKGVGGGVFERKIDFGPGYRVYFGKDGDTIVILLAGGTKKRQDRDIETARERWKDYKRRKT